MSKSFFGGPDEESTAGGGFVSVTAGGFKRTLTPFDEAWAVREGDPQSSGYASVVRAQLIAAKTSPATYLMQKDGLSRHQADEVVKTCTKMSLWEKFKLFIRGEK